MANKNWSMRRFSEVWTNSILSFRADSIFEKEGGLNFYMQWIVEIQSSSTDYMLRGSQEANRLELIKYICLHIYRYVYIYWKRKKRNAGYTYICLYNFDAGKIYI